MPQKNDISLQRLRGKSRTDLLFQEGKMLHTPHLRCCFYPEEKEKIFSCGVAVPKRKVKKAVKRNRIKRQLRVALKTNEDLLCFGGLGMLFFKGKNEISTEKIIEETSILFQKINEVEVKN